MKGKVEYFFSTTTSLTTGEADTCRKRSIIHIRAVYKLDGQI
jgi:hypothetical protein